VRPEELSWGVFLGSDVNSIFSKMHKAMSQDNPCERRWQQTLRAIFNAPDKKTAEQYLQMTIQKYARSAPRLSAWMEDNLAEGFTVFDFPLDHRRSIRTTNSLERINKEIRRRTRVVGVFPNEASCLRLISARLMEISEEWQIGKRYCAGKSFDC
jgi:putative transposase